MKPCLLLECATSHSRSVSPRPTPRPERNRFVRGQQDNGASERAAGRNSCSEESQRKPSARRPCRHVEVGVWMGGMSCILALTHLHDEAQSNSQVAKRNVWLFDTFQGMTAPTEDDGAVANKLYELVSTGGTPKVRDDPLRWNRDNRWNYSPLEEVRRTMA